MLLFEPVNKNQLSRPASATRSCISWEAFLQWLLFKISPFLLPSSPTVPTQPLPCSRALDGSLVPQLHRQTCNPLCAQTKAKREAIPPLTITPALPPHCPAAHCFSGCTKQLRPISIFPCSAPPAHTPPSPTFPCGAPSQLSRTGLGLQERGFVTIGSGGDHGVGRIAMVQVCTGGIAVLCPGPGQEEHLILPGHSHLYLHSAAVWAEAGQTGPVG